MPAPEPLLVGDAHRLLGYHLLGAKDHATARHHFVRFGHIGRKSGASMAEISALGKLSETYTGDRDFAAAQDRAYESLEGS